MKSWLSLGLILFAVGEIGAQSFSAHPPGLHWNKLQNKEVNIFFPQGLENKAVDIYTRLKEFYDFDTTLGKNRFKLNLVLQNQTVRSNGYVGVGPFISEFFLTPPHNSYVLGSVDWSEALAIHEYRHVLQVMNSRKGTTKWIYYLLGEEAWGAAYGLAVPDWFLEGDAVYAETKYTMGGRGKMPSFFSEFRALNKENIRWPYIKSRNGSLKDLVPNHYATGYPMVKYINDHFGELTWGKILEDAVKYKGKFYSFGQALRRHTGLSPSMLYEQAISKINIAHESSDTALDKRPGLKSNQKIKNYLTPNRLQDGSVFCLETRFDLLPSFVGLNSDKIVKRYTQMGISTDEDFGFTEPLATWTEIKLDPRWEQRNYSDIVSYNIYTGIKKKLSVHQKYFYPSPSNDASKIVCVESLPDGRCNLIVLDTFGKLLQTIVIPDQQLATYPAFESGDSSILVVNRKQGMASVVRYSIADGHAQLITQPVAGIVSNLAVNHDTIFFSSDVDGRDNLFAIDPVTKKIYQLTNDPIGIQQFSVLGNEIMYNIQTAYGIKIKSLLLDSIAFYPVNYFSENSLSTSTTLKPSLRSNTDLFKPASLWANPFRVYSWSIRPDEGGNVFSILGRNMLNTIQSSISYRFLQDDRSQSVSAGIALGLAYPVISTSFGHTWNRSISKLNNPKQDSIRWNENSFRIGGYIPLKFYHHNLIVQVQPIVQFGLYKPDYRIGDRNSYQATTFIRSGVQLLSYRRTAKQHFSSRFLQSVNLNWNRAINHRAQALELTTEWHLPGLQLNHVLELQADFHRQLRSDPYRFPNSTNFIAGYESFTSDRSTRWRMAYHMPLWYPDAGINGILYIMRIRTRLFHEQMNAVIHRTQNDFRVNYSSSGAEFLVDGKAMNVQPVSFGIRFSYLWDLDLIRNSKKPQFEFIIEQLF